MDRIEREGVIRTGAHGAVFCESARRRPLSPIEVEERYGVRRGRGRDYVEVDVPAAWTTERVNPTTGVLEWMVRSDIPLAAGATIVRRI